MFVKIADELEPRRSGEPYQFQIKTHEKSYRLAERIRALYAAARSRNPDVLSEDIKVDDSTIRTVVSHLEAVNLSATDPDVKGLAFEQFMGGFFKGDSGQYFTPREVVKFIVSMYPPDHSDRVIDPACGSGGFLLASLEHMRDKATEYGAPGTIEHQRYWQEFASRNLYGIEINDEIARVAKMNMTLHGDGRTNLVCEDGLTGLDRICRQTNNTGFAEGGFNLVLSNPPFGAQVSLGDRPYQGDYELGRTEDARGARRNRKSQKTEILFIERIFDLLIDEGRAAIILPDGVLTNASLQYVRDFILDRFRVEAVVSLPTLAFTHYGTTVKASVLFLRKRGSRDRPGDEEPIFMASPERIGYDSSGRPTDSQFDEILKQFRDFKRDPRPFFV